MTIPRLHALLTAPLLSSCLACAAALAEGLPFRAFPAPGLEAVCPDTPLRLVFPSTATAGAGGRISVHDADDGSLVEAIDVAAPVVTRTIGGLDGYRRQALAFEGPEAEVRLRPGALAYRKTYYITIDVGALLSGGTPCAAVAGPSAWRFTTRTEAPAAGAPLVTVAADGSGDFCTVQGALDFIPDGNTSPVTILVRRGLYREIVFFTNKHAITLLGEDRRGTAIACANNAVFNPSGGNPFAGPRPDPSSAQPRAGGSIYRRGMVLAHRVDDLTIANLTLHNTTPQGGTQAEALILNGTTTARAILRDLDLHSFQDTLQINGQAYVRDCRIVGDVDFLWGTGPCYFEACHARTVRSNAYFTQIRNPATNHGYVFRRCVFDGEAGVTNNLLSRIEPDRFPHSEVVLLDCTLGAAVASEGWMLQMKKGVPEPETPHLRFWELASTDPEGRPVDTSRRHRASRHLELPRDSELVARYRDPSFVLGSGWDPAKAPIFSKPLAETVARAVAASEKAAARRR